MLEQETDEAKRHMEAGTNGGSEFDHTVGHFQELRNREDSAIQTFPRASSEPCSWQCQDKALHLERRSSKMCCVI